LIFNMGGEQKQSLAKISEDIKSYIEYLRENDVTEVVSFAGKQKEKNAGPACPGASPAAGDTPGRSETSNALEQNSLPPKAELKSIADKIASCAKCSLHEKRTKTVPGQGNNSPEILFIGEGPGEDEDLQGLAFVGRAGQLLTRLILRMGFTRDEVFIANIVKCRPPNNRKPLPEEMNACRPYLERQIAVLRPKVIVLLGASALEGLIPSEAPGRTISRVRGKWLEYGGIPAMPTFHPSYLLRNQSAMWDVWNDMQAVLKHLGRVAPARDKQASK